MALPMVRAPQHDCNIGCYDLCIFTAGDYDRTIQTVTFLSGQSTASIPLSITDDLINEETEMLMASLSNPSSGLVLGERNVVFITITDDDGE